MAALTSDSFAPTNMTSMQVNPPQASGTTIFKGATVCINASGFACPAADSASFKVLGIAIKQTDNAGGGNGDINACVQPFNATQLSIRNATSPSETWLAKPVYVADDNRVALTGVNSVLYGTVVAILTTGTTGTVAIAPAHPSFIND